MRNSILDSTLAAARALVVLCGPLAVATGAQSWNQYRGNSGRTARIAWNARQSDAEHHGGGSESLARRCALSPTCKRSDYGTCIGLLFPALKNVWAVPWESRTLSQMCQSMTGSSRLQKLGATR
jgi:hypothetical protein